MACSRWTWLSLSFKALPTGATTSYRAVSTTCTLHGKRGKEPKYAKWGLERLPRQHPISIAALQDLPDFTYLDGRPTPLTKDQLERKQRTYDLAKRMVMLTKEMETARANYGQKIKTEQERREQIIQSKLLPKSSEL